MSYWFLILTILLVMVKGHQNDLLHFSRNIELLSTCLDDRLPVNLKERFGSTVVKIHINEIAKKLSGKAFIRENISHELFKDETIKSGLELRKEVEKAILQCSIVERYSTNGCIRVPLFVTEQRELARVLDYVLVNWTEPLSEMIRTRNGRALLRRYANHALAELESALTSVNFQPEFFRVALRILWLRRAQLLFDGRSIQLPYIIHRFDIHSDEPYLTRNFLQIFHNRNVQEFSRRNPLVPQLDTDRFLSIHPADRLGYEGECDIYSRYCNGMSSAGYYFETHVDQFYRVLFFIQELSSRGITSDEQDDYNSTIPEEVMSFRLQSIIYDDNQYRDYLLRRRNVEVQTGDLENPVIQNLARTARVQEQFLIMLRKSASTSWTQFNSTSILTTTTKTINTTPQNQQSKRNRYYSDKNRKHNENQRKTKFFDVSMSSNKKSGQKDFNKYKDLSLQEFFKYSLVDSMHEVFNLCSGTHILQQVKNSDQFYGYIVHINEQQNQLLFLEDESSIFFRSIKMEII